MDDQQSIELCMQLAQPGVWLDIGANLGHFTAQFSRGAALVLAFEPSFVSYMQLLDRTQSLGNVRCFPYALWNTQAVMQLYLGREGMTSGGNTIVQAKALSGNFGHSADQHLPVPAITADFFFSHCELPAPITFVKIDVEGAEQQVLEGMTALLRTHRPLICMEQHQMIDCAAIAGLLAELDYVITENGSDPVSLTIQIPGCAYILVPREQLYAPAL